MEKSKLSERDCEVLIEALTAWESKDAMAGVMGGVFSAMFADRLDEEGKKRLEQQEKEEERKRTEARKMREEESIIIKSKLIQIKNDICLSELQAC